MGERVGARAVAARDIVPYEFGRTWRRDVVVRGGRVTGWRLHRLLLQELRGRNLPGPCTKATCVA